MSLEMMKIQSEFSHVFKVMLLFFLKSCKLTKKYGDDPATAPITGAVMYIHIP